jgi:Na+/H+-dicarboxylate symporter
MHVLAFLLTVVGVALSLVYSDVFAMIAARGADLSWLKDLASLDAKTLCVLGSSALAVLGALFALCKKRFGPRGCRTVRRCGRVRLVPPP